VTEDSEEGSDPDDPHTHPERIPEGPGPTRTSPELDGRGVALTCVSPKNESDPPPRGLYH
jgi:hypothetical protein